MQAAILTGRRGKSAMSLSEIDDSVDRIVAGMEGTPMVDSKSKALVAYHEVGHAICGTLTPGERDTTISAFGFTHTCLELTFTTLHLILPDTCRHNEAFGRLQQAE